MFLSSIDANIQVECCGELASSDKPFVFSATMSNLSTDYTAPELRSCVSSLQYLKSLSRSPAPDSSSHAPPSSAKTVCSSQTGCSSQRVIDGNTSERTSESTANPCNGSSTRAGDRDTSQRKGESGELVKDCKLSSQMQKENGKGLGPFVLCKPGSFPIEHIDVGGMQSDHELFDELCARYRDRLSLFKWLLSINRFHHYGFDKVRGQIFVFKTPVLL